MTNGLDRPTCCCKEMTSKIRDVLKAKNCPNLFIRRWTIDKNGYNSLFLTEQHSFLKMANIVFNDSLPDVLTNLLIVVDEVAQKERV